MVWNFKSDLERDEQRLLECLLEGYDGHPLEFIHEDGNFSQSTFQIFILAERLEKKGYIRIEYAPFEEIYLHLDIMIVPKKLI